MVLVVGVVYTCYLFPPAKVIVHLSGNVCSTDGGGNSPVAGGVDSDSAFGYLVGTTVVHILKTGSLTSG